MAWWDDVLGLLKDEWKAAGGADVAAEPPTVKQAQTLLKRTSRELAEAKARAEAGRRRMLRAQTDLEALTRQPQQHPRYRDRLTELARAIAHESSMVESFDAHIQQLGAMHDRVQAQLREFERDLAMARTAAASAHVTSVAAPTTAPKRRKKGEPGFEHARPDELIERLRDLPGKRGGGEG
jgi:DNA repair ATPase RecN